MPTIKDVAQKAGVSTATVSRVINDPTAVSPETQKKVKQTIKQLNYQPNMLGRNLRRCATRMIMILLQNISNPFYSRVVRGIEKKALKNNYYTMICNNNSDPQQEKSYLQLLKSKLIDGVILLEPEIDKKDLQEIGSSFPVVQCCEYLEGVDIPHISIDNTAAARTAVNHLLDCGHTKIAMISGCGDLLSEKHREKGYREALENAGIKFRPEYVKYGSYGFQGGKLKAREILALPDRPSAIFAISDIMAIGAIGAITEAGLQVPDDVAVIGFDNTSISRMYRPPITTIEQPRFEMGSEAMTALLTRIENKKKNIDNKILEHKLIIRESTVT